VETGRFAVDDELRQCENPSCIILDMQVMVLKTKVHGVEQRDQFCEAEVDPASLKRAWLASHEGDNLAEMDFESLVYVFLPGSLPTDVLFVLTVAQLEVILNSLPVDGLGSGHSDAFLRGTA
jgi:hypothetical protein